MKSTTLASRRMTLTLAGLIAIASMLLVLSISGTREGHADDHHHGAQTAAQTAKAAAFHDGMRSLWEQHVTWTRLAIVSFAGDLPDLKATEARLLANQVHIGNAIKPYYGRAAGNRLTTLLKEHITGAVALLDAAKAGDDDRVAQAKTAWYANGREIADFLSSANRANWHRGEMRSMMATHLDQTLEEAVDQLTGKYTDGVRVYDAIERHIIEMADELSSGIVKQFPKRFR
jgi:hypothetical protein